MFDVVGHQITQREPVVCGDKVHARRGCPAVSIEDVGGAEQPLRQLTHSVGVAPPKVADMVAEAIIPFAPTRPEGAHLVAVRAHVPGFGNDLDLAQHRIFTDRLLERVILIDMMPLVSDQGAHQVEAEAVHSHLGDPVAQRVEHHPEHAGFGGVDRVAAAGDVVVVALVIGQPVVAEVVHTSEWPGSGPRDHPRRCGCTRHRG